MHKEGFSFPVSLLFASTALSTGGLVAPEVKNDGTAGWTIGFYCLIGIPLHAMLLAAVSGKMVILEQQARVTDTMHHFTWEDLKYLQMIDRQVRIALL